MKPGAMAGRQSPQGAAPASAEAAPARQVLGLDLIRFVAALLVMLFHLAYWSWAGTAENAVTAITHREVAFPELAPVTAFGWVGVEIFFVLSGVVICYSAEGTTAWTFARSRILRLYPAAWVCATVTLLLLLLLGQDGLPGRYARSLLLFPTGPWVSPVYWTLAYEMAFYGLVFLLLLSGRFRYLPQLLGALGLASAAYLALSQWHGRIEWGPAATVVRAALQLGHLPGHLVVGFGCFFALGGFLYLCVKKEVTFWRLALIGLCGAACLVIVALRSDEMARRAGVELDPLLPCALWLAAVLLMAGSLAWNEALMRRWRRGATPLRELGLATYPLYLLHSVLGAVILLGLHRAGANRWLALTGAMMAAVAVSLAVSRWFERPVKALLRRALSRGGGRGEVEALKT